MLLARWIVRSVPLQIVESSGHEKNIGNCVYSGAKPDQCGMSQIGKRLCLVMNPGFPALPLTPEHRQLRLQWCQARSMWNVTDWQKVVFSDESRFVLGTDDNRVRVWSHPGAIFQRDNARPHTTRVAQDFLRHFQTLPWPARSPDLSPVEHVWDQLKRQIPLCHSVHDLELVVQDLWAHLPQDNIRWLINSMPDRVAVRRGLNSSRSSASHWSVTKCDFQDLEPFLATRSAGRRPGQGRRRATVPNEDRYLVLTARGHRNMNATLLQQHLCSATGTAVSTQTVRNRLHGVGLYAHRPMVCVRLASRHRRDRREWTTEHVNWKRNEWSNVLFSDESRFSVHPDNRRIFIWRDRGSRNIPAFVHESVRFGGGGVLVYGVGH
ncbi:transposable element Tcb2 transposase [Trichonephila clavipes]|nr:transposable element Tcb2 transposase [Trichonephila clavipes]